MSKPYRLHTRSAVIRADALSLAIRLGTLSDSLFWYKFHDTSGREWFIVASLADSYACHADRVLHNGHAIPEAVFNQWLRRASTAVYDNSPDVPFSGGVLFLAGFEFDRIWDREAQELRLQGRDGNVPSGPLAVFCAPQSFLLFDCTDSVLHECVVGDGHLSPVALPALRTVYEEFAAGRVLTGPEHAPKRVAPSPACGFPLSEYRRRFSLLRPYFERGEIYQAICPATYELELPDDISLTRFKSLAFDSYRHTPFAYMATVPGTTIMGFCALPHILLVNGRLETQVFAGTLPAPRTPAELAAARERFTTDKSFLAEHLMLVDFERNDFNRMCTPESVSTSEALSTRQIGATVYLSTTVKGTRKPGTTIMQCALGTIPRGVVSGAPRKRACEVLSTVEREQRGWYGGAIGLVDSSRQSISSNSIVTCALVSDRLRIPVGSGVLVDSDFDQQVAELECKARILVELAERCGT